MSADDDIAAKEAEALFKIHGVDQRSAELAFSHPALGGEDAPVRMRQDGSTSKAFVPGTSTVIWPCAYSLGDYLCDATTAYRAKLGDGVGDATEAARVGAVTADTVAVELGAGLGLGGMVAARLGARHVAITDSTPAAASRNVQANGLGNAHVSELWWRRAAWRRAPKRDGDESESDIDDEPDEVPTAEDAVKSLLASLPDGRAPHIVIGSDICYSQGKQEMQALVDTLAAMCEPSRTTAYVVFEDRGDCCWGTLNYFWTAAESAGLVGDPTPVQDVAIDGKKRSGPGRHNDSERLLLRLTKRAAA